jgi:phenylalanyl-tRNA synthetase beta chain
MNLQKQFDIRYPVYYAVIYWGPVMRIREGHRVKHRELPRFPEVRRDLALLLDEQVTFERVRGVAFNTEKKLLTRVTLFDVYEGEKIQQGKKSYAVSFVLQDREATLRDDRIDRIMQKLIDAYRTELGAEIR